MANFAPDEKSRPVMGYPSMPPYQLPPARGPGHHHQGYGLPYHGYLRYNNPQPHFSPSSKSYYTNKTYDTLVSDETDGNTIGRIMFTLLIVFLVAMCFVSLIAWVLFGSEVPEFQVSSLSVSSFKVTNSGITGKWDANIRALNTNSDREVDFDRVRTSIFYHNHLLATASQPATRLKPKQEICINTKLRTNETVLEEGVVAQIEDDRSRGAIVFSMKLAFNAKFAGKANWINETIKVFCEHLKVSVTPTGDGNLTEVSARCLIFL